MHLKEYLILENIKISHLAKRLGITGAHLGFITSRKSKPGSELAKKIEEETNYKVNRLELLYPDEFHNKNYSDEEEKIIEAAILLEKKKDLQTHIKEEELAMNGS